ncbi:sugar 3,4-ketoisomerase [Tardiphaga sp. vice304]|uniref:sugar 3,4-ketoisomerase n=1 Tax=Tardiphaga sp. vice304 TaxID=2592817 RepID=UPI00143D0DCA
MAHLINGVELLDLQFNESNGATLLALEEPDSLPFAPKRVFFLKVTGANVMRSGHANSCDEFVVAQTGSVLIEVDNGSKRSSIRLRADAHGLWIKRGVFIQLSEFEPNTIVLVCASELYNDTMKFDSPQPSLLA